MKRQRLIQLIVTFICAVFFVCAGFAVSDYFKREDTVTARAAVSPDIYWGVNGDTLTIDTSYVSGSPSGHITDGNFTSGTYWTELVSKPAAREKIKTVSFANKISPSDVTYMFSEFTNLEKVENFAKNLDLSNATSLEGVFLNCRSLTTLDVADLDVSNINIFFGLFSGCSSLKTIDVSKWNMSKAENINAMFRDCVGLSSIDVSQWKVTNVKNMFNVFRGCSGLTQIDLSQWKTTNLLYFGYAFAGCTKLRSLDLSGIGIGTDYTRFDNAFENTLALEALKLSSSVVNILQNPNPPPGVTNVQDPKLPTLKDKNGNTYNDVNSLPSAGGVFLTNVKHTHDHRAKDTGTVTPPTCTERGYTTYTCFMCDEIFNADYVNPAPHSFTNYVYNNDATCTADGTETAKCDNCAQTDTRTKTGSMLPHVQGIHHDAVAATCSKAGNVEYWECANSCGKFIDDSLSELSTVTIPINPTAHSFTNYVSNNNATCTDNATETADCLNGCGQTDTREILGTAKGHKWATAWSKDATNHWHVCENGCGVKGGETAHVYNWVTDTPATLTTSGIKHEECLCGAKRNENTEIPIQTCAHANLTHYDRVEATCVAAGNIEYWHCADCNKNLDSVNTELPDITIPIDNTAHVFTNYVSNNDATCTADGTKTAQCDHGCGTKDTIADTGTQLSHSFTNYVSNNDATCNADGTKTAQCDHGCGATDTVTDTGSMKQHSYEWVITKPATKDEAGLMQNKCTVCGDVAEEKEIAKLEDPNGGGEIDLPVDINVEFKVTQSSTENDYSELDGMKRGYWAQLWYRNEDGTLGDEFTDTMNCFLTLKIPTEIIEAIRGGDEINRDKIAEGLTVYYYVDGQRYNVDNFAIAQRDDESWQIKFNYNAKFRAEVVFNAPEYKEQSPAAGIPWWVWLIVGLAGAAVVGVVIVIIVVAKKKNSAAVATDNGEVLGRLDKQDEKLNEIREIVDGGFNDIVDDE